MVSGRTVEEQLEVLNRVLTRLTDALFVLNLQKSEFFMHEAGYLVHAIDQDGLHEDHAKVKSIRYVKSPKVVQEVNHYAKFGQV